MVLTHCIKNRICTIHIEGEMIFDTTPKIKAYFTQVQADKTLQGFIIDFQNITYLDSSGASLLLFLFRTLKDQKIKMAVCQLNKDLSWQFEKNRLNQIIACYSTEEKALASF
ncbi:MAG: STAS domain-containing protein [SAR324 cluster bacterium]|nr:STAS domain-containing protein [SAR324 cluster bacterium]